MFLPQIIVPGYIKGNGPGGEIISFSVPLGPLTLVCIVNIPGEGESEAPVYVKFKIDTRPYQKPRRRPEALNRPSSTGLDQDQGQEDQEGILDSNS